MAGPGHLVALEEAAAAVSRRHGITMASLTGYLAWEFLRGRLLPRIEAALGRPLTEDERAAFAEDMHGGLWETSFMLWLRPDLVDPGFRTLPPARYSLPRRLVPNYPLRNGGQGYVGHPALADAAFARATAEVLLREGHAGWWTALLDGRAPAGAAPLALLRRCPRSAPTSGGRRRAPRRRGHWRSGGTPGGPAADPPAATRIDKRRSDMKAYVLIETAAGKTKSVKKALAKVKGARATVIAMDAVTGPYDFIAVVDGSSLDAIGNLVTESIGVIDGRDPYHHLRGGVHRLRRGGRPRVAVLESPRHADPRHGRDGIHQPASRGVAAPPPPRGHRVQPRPARRLPSRRRAHHRG